ncbi:MYND-type domain-containing protein [Favolaschia claudopus]|uniref:MYND-type domain-containing protein n=1 Tax=Favolaschia claudopus TaxID=2862362 RepID=A0AAW0CB11_9AGAR
MPILDSRLGLFVKDVNPERICQSTACPRTKIGYGGIKMPACGQCKYVRYCSKSCQRADWRKHKLYCHIPPVLDIARWMEKHEPLFRWALIEGLDLRNQPSNILTHCLLVQLVATDRLMMGPDSSAPSHFYVDSVVRTTFKAMQRNYGMPVDNFAHQSQEIIASGGLGRGIVIFAITTGSHGRKMCRVQYHPILEALPPSPPLADWQITARAIANGDLPLALPWSTAAEAGKDTTTC